MLRVAWVVLDLLYPITPTIGVLSPTGTSGDNTPGSPDFPRCRVWPTTPQLWVFRPGGAQCRQDVAAVPFVTRCNNQVRHASPPKNDTWPTGRSVVTMSFSRAGDLRAVTTTRHPVDRVQGTAYKGGRKGRQGWEFVDVLVAWSCDVMRASRVENMLPRALALFRR